MPPRREGPPSPAELAGWFRLDADALCAANGVTPAACAGHAFAPGQVAVLPLGRGAAGADGVAGTDRAAGAAGAAASPGDAPVARRP